MKPGSTTCGFPTPRSRIHYPDAMARTDELILDAFRAAGWLGVVSATVSPAGSRWLLGPGHLLSRELGTDGLPISGWGECSRPIVLLLAEMEVGQHVQCEPELGCRGRQGTLGEML